MSTVSEAGAKAFAVQADVSKSVDREAMVQSALELSGPKKKIDILVHNAAIWDKCGLADLTDELYDRIDDANVKGKASLTRKFIVIALSRSSNEPGRISKPAPTEQG